jgi:hypothetical protein
MSNLLNVITQRVHARSSGNRAECAVTVLSRSAQSTDRPVDCVACLVVLGLKQSS